MSTDLHRFMSFAFAGADLLLELDAHKRVAFALGATSGLTAGSDAELVGKAADIVFHLMVALDARGLSLADVKAERERREGVSGIAEKAARREG